MQQILYTRRRRAAYNTLDKMPDGDSVGRMFLIPGCGGNRRCLQPADYSHVLLSAKWLGRESIRYLSGQ